ncbi:lipopolysaccharide biosynthesis protein [Psychrobacillus sp. NEAU-3TGS]|uniref:lipopolysaccharide biosynthesis protein n=1 Tax=Psychrobacillus sp. NEAU-3TGS TaxID=2995412 RepID=UPI0024979DD9|nr:lipopolysaccharide biosynthesis protein [Psychrobacillus sp. NEAU-3TGS]MDI2586531.1 lipopolysaccharide biosynthesis protein [Psychrobacillus sp. NEAU-3TGS]
MKEFSSLKKKTISAVFWSFFDLIANHGIQFIIQIILARLLLPEHFGVIGMILVFIAISNSIVDSGFTQALIRDQHTTQEDYSTIFYFNLVMSFILYVMLFISSKSISIFFEEPQLVEIIRVLSIVVIINSLAVIQKVMLMKRVDFRTITKISMVSSFVSGTITIVVALLGFGVWSLVINMIALQFFQTLLFFFYNRWLPSFTFNYQSFKRFFGFGSKLLLSGLIDTIYNNIFFFIIGKAYSSIQLGYYSNAVKFRDLASQSLASTIQRVTYPVLSAIQEDEERLKLGFKRIIRISAFINFPLLIGLAATANPLFHILFGEKWIPSVIYFQLLCFAGMLYPLHALNLNILQVKGRSDLYLLIEIIKKSFFSLLILLSFFLKLGIIGLICAAMLNSYVSLFINTYFSAKEIAYSFREQLKDLMFPFLISLLMGVSVYLLGDVLPSNHFVQLVFQIIIGIIIYIGMSKILRIQELTVVFELLVPLLSKIKYWSIR